MRHPDISHPVREYIVMVSRLWGKLIAGPVAAVCALIGLVIGLTCHLGPVWTSVLSGAPLLVAIVLIWPAQYQAWRVDRKALEVEIGKNSLPELVIEIAAMTIQVWDRKGGGDSLMVICDLCVHNKRDPITQIKRILYTLYGSDGASSHTEELTTTGWEIMKRPLKRGELNKERIMFGVVTLRPPFKIVLHFVDTFNQEAVADYVPAVDNMRETTPARTSLAEVRIYNDVKTQVASLSWPQKMALRIASASAGLTLDEWQRRLDKVMGFADVLNSVVNPLMNMTTLLQLGPETQVRVNPALARVVEEILGETAIL